MKVKGFLMVVMMMVCIAGVFGCASNVIKAEKDVAIFMKDDSLSPDCKAGIAAAAVLAPNTSADIRIAAEGVQKYANKESEEFKTCYTKTAFISFAVRGGIDEVSKIARELVTLGVMK